MNIEQIKVGEKIAKLAPKHKKPKSNKHGPEDNSSTDSNEKSDTQEKHEEDDKPDEADEFTDRFRPSNPTRVSTTYNPDLMKEAYRNLQSGNLDGINKWLKTTGVRNNLRQVGYIKDFWDEISAKFNLQLDEKYVASFRQPDEKHDEAHNDEKGNHNEADAKVNIKKLLREKFLLKQEVDRLDYDADDFYQEFQKAKKKYGAVSPTTKAMFRRYSDKYDEYEKANEIYNNKSNEIKILLKKHPELKAIADKFDNGAYLKHKIDEKSDTPPNNEPPKESNEKSTPDEKHDEQKQYTKQDFENKLKELIETYPQHFLHKYMRKDAFIRMFRDMAHDKQNKSKFQELMRLLDKPKLNTNTITDAAVFLRDNMPPFEHRLKLAERDLFDLKEHKFRSFKRGDKVPRGIKDMITEIMGIFTDEEITKSNINDRSKHKEIRQLLDSVFQDLGFRFYYDSRGGNIRVIYDEDDKEAKLRRKGKEDQDIGNSNDFFSYDMHDIIEIIERQLNVKLSDADKTNIEAIIEKETRDLRYKTNIRHGISPINDLINEIEAYINKRKRIDGHVFRFSEYSRLTLKEILKKVAKSKVKSPSHGSNSQELMFRLLNLRL